MWERIQNYLPYVITSYDPGRILLELLIIGVVVYSVIRFLRGTGGERLFKGLVILLLGSFAINVLTNEWDLERIDLLFRSFLLIALMVALVAFQPELRRALMRLGGAWARRHTAPQMQQVIEQVVDATAALSHKQIGALIAFEREIPLGDLMAAATPLDASVTAELLQTVFWPGSPLHDMGVIIQGERVSAAAVQFPLAEHGDFDRTLGSRHRAAIGLSKTTDAVVVLVSEETGQIALAVDGKLTRFLTLEQLRQQLLDLMVAFAGKKRPARKAPPEPTAAKRPAADTPKTAGTKAALSFRWTWIRTAVTVVVLSGIIWMFAERSVIEEDELTARIFLPESHENLLLQFTIRETLLPENFQIVTLKVKGPTGAILRAVEEEYEVPIVLDIAKLSYEPAGPEIQNCSVPVVSLFDGRLPVGDGTYFGITESTPENIHVRVTKLTKRTVDVIVLDEQTGNLLTTDQTLTVEAYVPPDLNPIAKVFLNEAQRAAAMKGPIEVFARIQLAPNRIVEYPLYLKLPPTVTELADEKVTSLRLYVSIPSTMLGRYDVIIDDKDRQSTLDAYSPIECRGPGAKEFRNSLYHLVLDIEPDDKNQQTERGRPLRYNTPPGVEIINPKAVPIRFRIEPRKTTEQNPTPGP